MSPTKDEVAVVKNGCWIKHAKWTGLALGTIFAGIIGVLTLFASRMENAAQAAEQRMHIVLKELDERVRVNEQIRTTNMTRLDGLRDAIRDVKDGLIRIEQKLGKRP